MHDRTLIPYLVGKLKEAEMQIALLEDQLFECKAEYSGWRRFSEMPKDGSLVLAAYADCSALIPMRFGTSEQNGKAGWFSADYKNLEMYADEEHSFEYAMTAPPAPGWVEK